MLKKPLCQYNGVLKELQDGDTLPQTQVAAIEVFSGPVVETPTTYDVHVEPGYPEMVLELNSFGHYDVVVEAI